MNKPVKHDTWPAYTLLVIISVISPLIGVILGIIGLIQDKQGSLTLLIVGIISWIVWGGIIALLVGIYFL